MRGGRMIRSVLQAACAALLLLIPAQPAAAKHSSALQADLLEKAFAAKDTATRDAVAAKEWPDPWLVIEELRRRERLDLCRFLAEGLIETERAAVTRYLEAQAGRPFPTETYALLTKVLGMVRLDRAKAGELLNAHEPDVSTVIGVEVLFGRGEMLLRAQQPQACAKAYEAAGDAADAIGWHRRAAEALRKGGHVLERAGMYVDAMRLLDKSAASAAKVPMPDREGVARYLQGMCTNVIGKTEEALALFEVALARGETAKSLLLQGMALDGMGSVHEGQGRSWTALELRERSLVLARKAGNDYSTMVGLSNLAATLMSLGHYERAYKVLGEAHQGARKLAEQSFEAVVLLNMGVVAMNTGDFDAALLLQDRAIAIGLALGERPTIAKAKSLKASTYLELGDNARAKPLYESALADLEAMNDVASAAAVLENLGHLADRADAQDEALTYYRRARAMREGIGDLRGSLRLQQTIAATTYHTGDAESALDTLQDVLAAQQALKDAAGVTQTRTNMAFVLRYLGRHTEAVAMAEQAVREAEAAQSDIPLIHALSALGDAQLGARLPLDARVTAQRGIQQLRLVAGRQAQEQEASARERFSNIYQIGALACWANEDPAGLFLFLEAGRASALRRVLGGGAAIRKATVSDALRAKEVKLRRVEGRARDYLHRARATGKRRVVREARKELDAARAALDELIGKMERESRRGSELLYSRPETLDVVRRHLAPEEALIVYGLLGDHCCALVARRDTARIVDLGVDAREMRRACLALSWNGAEDDAAAKLARIRELAMAKLALPKEVRRLLISPAGELALVPFSALDLEREIVIVPSGTAYAQLRAAKPASRTRGPVLALGDPAYDEKADVRPARQRAGDRLVPLPETRAEVQAIGTVQLLGKEATESGFRAALTKHSHWRAVHFACHGLLDVERPKFSSLALTHTPMEDGHLTAAEIVDLRLKADLVALSACDTGRGKIFRAEGVLGLTRAFFFAGAPRVLSSLWKVDSAATKALMVKFYALWNPKDTDGGLSAAAALRAAQAHIRAQEKWKHPYYWSAWVLSGLPE